MGEKNRPIRREAGDPGPRFSFAEIDVAFLVGASAFDDLADLVVRDRRRERVKNSQDEPFAERHLEADVFPPGSAHHPGRHEFHGRVGISGHYAEEILDSPDPLHVRELFGRLTREETRGRERRRPVEPMTALDAGDLAVEELVEDPREKITVTRLTGIEAGASEIVLKLISLDQHMKRVYNPNMAVQITEWTDRAGRSFPRLQSRGKSLTEAFQTAAKGFFSLITDVETIRPTTEVVIFCESSDSDWLFSDWINTLIYEIRERRMIFSEFHVEVDGINVKGKIRGETIDPNRHPLLRPTLSGAAFDELFAIEEGGEARVSAVLNDWARHPLPLREIWAGLP